MCLGYSLLLLYIAKFSSRCKFVSDGLLTAAKNAKNRLTVVCLEKFMECKLEVLSDI